MIRWLNILSLSHTHINKKSELTNFLPKIASLAFDHEITLHLISFASFCEPSVRCCSSKRCTSVAFPPAFLFPTHTTSGRRCCSGEPKDKKRANVCSSHSEKMCVRSQRGTDDSLCFQQRALHPFGGGEGGALTHEYLALQLTVIGYCCEPCGLVCAHCPCIRQQTAAASHPTSDGGLDGFKTTWNKKQCGCNCAQ